MRLVFFGSGEFGVPTLSALVSRGHEVAAVATQPDRPAGRGAKCRSTPIKCLAEGLGLPVLEPEKPALPEFAAEIARLGADLAVVVAYGHLLKKSLLDATRLGFVNLHASLLPAYRGAAPVPWAILRGETESGVTIFRLDERFDTGAILARAALPILPDDTSASYLAKLAPVGADLMAETVAELAAGRARPQPQDNVLASQAPKLRKEDGAIDWSRPYAEIERRVRAFQPWPLAHTVLQTCRGPLRVNIMQILPGGPADAAPPPGTVLAADSGEGLWIAAGDRRVRLCQLQPEGKRVMADKEFLRGTRVL